ncbi:hypothetical protein D3C84_1114670 [compost metagenome]
MHGRVSQVVEELVEERGANRVQWVVTGPARQLFNQFLLPITTGHFTQGPQ